jgi:hypothetical protein
MFEPGVPMVTNQPGDRSSKLLAALQKRESFKVPAELVQEARNAVFWLRAQGRHEATLAGLVEDAVRAHLDQLKQEHNNGQDFPMVRAKLPRGRPLGRP